MLLDEAAYRLAVSRRSTIRGGGSMARAHLSRPFPRKARHRILLAYYVHQLAEPQFLPFFRYGARFRRKGIAFRAIPFDELTAEAATEATALFFQAPYDVAGPLLDLRLTPLRAARPELPITFFDWAAPADLRFAGSVAPFADHYVKKAILHDRGAYLRGGGGHTNLTDHYAGRFGTANPVRDWIVPPDILDRLHLGPAFSTGSSLIARFEREPTLGGHREIDLHARIATKGTPWYEAMRGEAKAAVAKHFGDLRVAAEGFVPPRRYLRELRSSKICFSPFGYGELCWRDFEAAALGAVMLKPDMAHLDVAPDIYRPFETYVPIRWDLTDINEKVRALLADPEERLRLARNAFDVARDHLRGPELEMLVDDLLVRRSDAPAVHAARTAAAMR